MDACCVIFLYLCYDVTINFRFDKNKKIYIVKKSVNTEKSFLNLVNPNQIWIVINFDSTPKFRQIWFELTRFKKYFSV